MITNAQAKKLGQISESAQQVRLGMVIQNLSGSQVVTAVHTNGSAVTLTWASGSMPFPGGPAYSGSVAIKSFNFQIFRGGSSVPGGYASVSGSQLTIASGSPYGLALSDVIMYQLFA